MCKMCVVRLLIRVILIGTLFCIQSTDGEGGDLLESTPLPPYVTHRLRNFGWGPFKNQEIYSKSRRHWLHMYRNGSYYLNFRQNTKNGDESGFPAVVVNVTVVNANSIVNGSHFNETNRLRHGQSILVGRLRVESDDPSDPRTLGNPNLKLDIQLVRAVPPRPYFGIMRWPFVKPALAPATLVRHNHNGGRVESESKYACASTVLGWLYAVFWTIELCIKYGHEKFYFRKHGMFDLQFYGFACYVVASYYFVFDAETQNQYYGVYPNNVGLPIPIGPYDIIYSTTGLSLALGFCCIYWLRPNEDDSAKKTLRVLESITCAVLKASILCTVVLYMMGYISWFLVLVVLLMAKLLAHFIEGICWAFAAFETATKLNIVVLIWTLLLDLLGACCCYSQVATYMMAHGGRSLFIGDAVKIGLSFIQQLVSLILLFRVCRVFERMGQKELLGNRETLLKNFEKLWEGGKVAAAVTVFSKYEATFDKLEKVKITSQLKALTEFASTLSTLRTKIWGKIILKQNGALLVRIPDINEAHKLTNECMKRLLELPGSLYRNAIIQSELYSFVALIAHRRGNLITAFRNCEHALKDNPKNEKALLLLGYMYSNGKQFKEAVDEYKKALMNCSPKMIDFVRYLLESNLKSLKETIDWTPEMEAEWQDFKKKLASCPNHVQAAAKKVAEKENEIDGGNINLAFESDTNV